MEQMNPMGNMSDNASVSSSVKTVCLFSQHTSMTDLINLSIRVKNTTCQEIVFQEPQELSRANWLAQMLLCVWWGIEKGFDGVFCYSIAVINMLLP